MKQLHQLLKSLNKREKFYFKKYYDYPNSKNFIRLYDFLIANPNADIDKLKKYFKGDIIGKNIHYEINNLYQKILRVLNIYRTNKSSINFQILQNLQNVDILIEKKQLSQAKKLIAKTKTTAYKYEELSIIMKIIELEQELRFTQIDSDIAKNIKQLEEERTSISTKTNEYNNLRLLKNQFVDFQFKEGLITVNPKDFPNIFQNPLLKSIDNVKTKKAKDLWYFNKSMAYSLVGNYEQAKKVRESRLFFLRENQDLFTIQEQLFALNNYLFLMVQKKDKISFFEKHSDLISLLEDPKNPKSAIKFFSFYLLLALHITLENIAAINKLFPAVFDFIKENINTINPTQRYYLFFYTTKAMVTIKDYHNASLVLNLWNRYKMEGIRFIRFKMLWLITHYSLGNFLLLNSELYNLTKTIRSKKLQNDNLQLLINFLKKVLKSNENQKNQLLDLENGFLKLYKDFPDFYVHIFEVDLAHWAKNFNQDY